MEENYKPTIRSSRVSNNEIVIMLESVSIAELMRMDELAEQLKQDLNITNLVPPIFWFSRIKATTEGRGDGTVLMTELCRICDEYSITVVDALNPYGQRGLADLIRFNQKFGFVLYGESLMIRFPKVI